MTSQDRLDERLIEAVRDYNSPGPVPREKMWAAISAARAASRRSVATDAIPHAWVWPAAGLAAAALIAVGVLIGRSTRDSQLRTIAVGPAVAVTPPVAAKPDTAIVGSLHEETRKTDAAVRRLAASRPSESHRLRPRADSREPIAASRYPIADSPQRQLAYRLIVLRHLAGSEALITSFRSSARRGEADAQMAEWSKELLGTTRLLETSPAADDPVMKRLLEDLDLVIAQIAQYSARGTYNPEELDLIEQSITRRGVMTKLRGTTAPSAAQM